MHGREEKGQMFSSASGILKPARQENGGKCADGDDASPHAFCRRATCGFPFERQNANPIRYLFFIVLSRLSASPSACPQVGQVESQREIYPRPSPCSTSLTKLAGPLCISKNWLAEESLPCKSIRYPCATKRKRAVAPSFPAHVRRCSCGGFREGFSSEPSLI